MTIFCKNDKIKQKALKEKTKKKHNRSLYQTFECKLIKLLNNSKIRKVICFE